MIRIAIAFVLCFCSAVGAVAQACPGSSAKGSPLESAPQTLTGKLLFHNGLRQWFELRLDQPKCGQHSVELVTLDRAWTSIQVLRGCSVRVRGPLGDALTGYYSLEVYQDVKHIEPVGNCVRQPPFPDYSKARPAPNIREYRVEMQIDYEQRDTPITFKVTSGGRELHPWQAYASYFLTGGFVLYGNCANGFVVGKVFGNPEAQPDHFEDPGSPGDQAMFDPDDAASAGIKHLKLGYSCIRGR